MLGQYQYNPDFSVWTQIFHIFTLSLWSGFLAMSDLFKTELCMNMFHRNMWISYFTGKTGAYFSEIMEW